MLNKSNQLNFQVKAVISVTNRISLAVFIATMVITFGLAWHVILFVRDSIENLQRGTEQWSRGNLLYQIPDLGSDELGRLAAAFNAMALNLQRAISDVQDASRKAEAANPIPSNRGCRNIVSARIRYPARSTRNSDKVSKYGVAVLTK